MIHRLVYSTWSNSLNDFKQINHKNSKPNINYLFNLEEISALENIRYSIKFNSRNAVWSIDQVYNICEYIQQGLRPDEIYKKINLDKNNIKINNFRSFCSYLKNKEKYWVDVSSKFNFENSYSQKRKYNDDLIYEVLDLLNSDTSQKEISEKLNIDFRVVSDIKRGIKNHILNVQRL